MISKLFAGWALMALCVVVHAIGLTFAMRWLRHRRIAAQQFWPWTWLFIRLAGWIVLLHLMEITLWALFYWWKDAMPDMQSAFYFSAVTYTTTGYGDLVLPREWHLVGGIEALTGILMCGWSTGFFFALLSRMFEADRTQAAPGS
jgi:Ion channel